MVYTIHQLKDQDVQAQRAYKKLKEQFEELQSIRHTEAEARLEALIEQSNARAEGEPSQCLHWDMR